MYDFRVEWRASGSIIAPPKALAESVVLRKKVAWIDRAGNDACGCYGKCVCKRRKEQTRDSESE